MCEWPKWHVARKQSRERFLFSPFKRPQEIQRIGSCLSCTDPRQAFIAGEQLAGTAHLRESFTSQTWPLFFPLHIYSKCRTVYIPQRWKLKKKSMCRIYQLFKSYCYLLYRSNPLPLNWILTVVKQIRQAVREGRDGARGLS